MYAFAWFYISFCFVGANTSFLSHISLGCFTKPSYQKPKGWCQSNPTQSWGKEVWNNIGPFCTPYLLEWGHRPSFYFNRGLDLTLIQNWLSYMAVKLNQWKSVCGHNSDSESLRNFIILSHTCSLAWNLKIFFFFTRGPVVFPCLQKLTNVATQWYTEKYYWKLLAL